MDNRAIGIFDSGVGGLSAVKSMQAVFPHENVIYFGDTARVPYGSRTPEEIIDFSLQDVSFLRIFNLKAILIACNTITAWGLGTLRRQNTELPIFGVVDSAAIAAVHASISGRIGLLATKATVDSGIYEKQILAMRKDARVYSVRCPRFVPLIESGHIDPGDPELQSAVEEYCISLREADVDTVILGCTHYPLIAEAIGNYMGRKVCLIDSGGESVRGVIEELTKRDQLAGQQSLGQDRYFCSGPVEQFSHVADMFLHKNIQPEAMQINIEKF